MKGKDKGLLSCVVGERMFGVNFCTRISIGQSIGLMSQRFPVQARAGACMD